MSDYTTYTTESPASTRARERRRRTLVTFAVVLLGLFFAFWYALSYYRDVDPLASPSAEATCRPYDPNELAPAQVTVNVLNATDRNGLAGLTSRSMAERGFVVGKVANDASGRKTPAVAEVRHGPQGTAQAKLVLTVMPEGTALVNDKRKGAVVDVALGTKFERLAPQPTASALPRCPAPTGATPSPSPA